MGLLTDLFVVFVGDLGMKKGLSNDSPEIGCGRPQHIFPTILFKFLYFFQRQKKSAASDYSETAEPVLLEPIGSLSVFVPDDNTGDMMGELNKRRGRVLGMNPAEKKGMTEIVAEVPMAEMADFTLLLRQMTQGQGVFTFEKARYEPLPANLVADVIAKNAVAD